MGHALQPKGSNALSGQCASQLIARQLSATLQGLYQCHTSASKDLRVEFKLAVLIGADGVNAWSREGKHPANVRGCNKVPGGAQQMSPENGARRERPFDCLVCGIFQAQSQSPFCCVIVLRLHCPQPSDHFLRLLESG